MHNKCSPQDSTHQWPSLISLFKNRLMRSYRVSKNLSYFLLEIFNIKHQITVSRLKILFDLFVDRVTSELCSSGSPSLEAPKHLKSKPSLPSNALALQSQWSQQGDGPGLKYNKLPHRSSKTWPKLTDAIIASVNWLPLISSGCKRSDTELDIIKSASTTTIK